MQNWMLPRITDYWDEQVQAIDRLSRVLDAVPPSQRDGQVALIRAAIARHVSALSDVDLTRAANCVADDLYKAVDRLSYWDHALETYLLASAGSFFEAVRTRGYILSYIVDNNFDDLTRPVRWFPMWYKPTGLCYICPQLIAYSLQILENGGTADELQQPLDPTRLGLIPSYIEEAREIASQLIRKCRDDRRHFVFLATDSHEGCLSAALDASGHPGMIRAFRNEPPIPGSRCTVSFPN